MVSRRRFIGAAGMALLAPRAAMAASTPAASTPVASPVAGDIAMTGTATYTASNGEADLEIDVQADGDDVEGTFTITLRFDDRPPIEIVSTELTQLKPLSEMSPHIKRLGGYVSVNGAAEEPFILDLTKARDDDEDEAMSLVTGSQAAPFLGEEVKLGCDCNGPGQAFQGTLSDGDITINES